MEKGQLVPDELVVKMVLEHIAGNKKGFILDGFPRTIEQAKALDKAFVKDPMDKAILIDVTRDELLRRLTGRWICRKCQKPFHMVSSPPKVAGKCDACGGELYQRADDTMETAKNRLEVYNTQTAPLIDYYRKQGKLLELNGERPIEEVSKELLKKLGWRGDAHRH